MINRGSYYSIFKTKPNLMTLFDTCKTLEENLRVMVMGDTDDPICSTVESRISDCDFNQEDIEEYGKMNSIISIDPAMRDVKYLKPKSDKAPQYTLVLDLDETLIHYHANGLDDEDMTVSDEPRSYLEDTPCSSNRFSDCYVDDDSEAIEFSIRPGLSSFLNELSKYYELVLYTAATREYADYFLRRIDPKNLFGENILTREHVKFDGDFAIKDLRLLGRDLRKTIIIDNLEENFSRTTPDNGIHCSDFEGCFDDAELPMFKQFLTKLALNEEPDVRNVLYDYRGKWETYE